MVKQKIRTRHRISFDLTEEQIEQIDGSRGTLARSQFLRERIFLSHGFANPMYGVVSRLLGRLSAHQPDAWEATVALSSLMQEMSAIRRGLAKHEITSELEQMLGLALEIETELSSLLQLATGQKEILLEIRSAAIELVKAITPPEPALGKQPGPQLHRPTR